MSDALTNLLLQGTLETLYMVGLSGFLSVLGGLPLGVILFITKPGGILNNFLLRKNLGFVVDVIRAIPFIILLIVVAPLTRLLTGTSIGTTASIVPLSIAAIPFVGRIIENTLVEVHDGLIEAGQAMGATNWQLIYKILIPEARPAIIRGLTVTMISLVGYSAMAGIVGGGGLGALAIYAYQRFDYTTEWSTVVVLVVLVFFIQWLGDLLAKRWEH